MPYLPGRRPEASGPLSRFLPLVPEGVARAYCTGLNLPGAWVLDPFAASPRLAVELARAGQRVLVTAGNPVSRFLLDLTAHPPRLADLQAALADLAAARKEGKRLETHLQSLYFTICENCGRELAAEAFLWDSKTGLLTGRIYNCVCGSGGEHPATPLDAENAERWARSDGLHRTRALGRVAPAGDSERPFAEEALGFYLPRAVYAIGTIVNRLDTLSDSDERRRCMSALLLYAADAANALWAFPFDRPRPRQLSYPAVYRENNIWLALEAGVKAWAEASGQERVPLTLWPEEPPESGGICIFEGPLRDLAADLEEIPFKAVIGAIPRPNQAFWTLSALWSGWLWGQAAVGPFKSVLRRRRYDWQWHAEALKALFGNLLELIGPETPVFAILSEAEPSFASAVLLAAQSAGLTLNGLAMHSEPEPLQLLWKKTPPVGRQRAKKPQQPDVHFARKAMREILEQRGEPMPYIHLHTTALAALAGKGMLAWADETLPALEKTMHTALEHPDFIDLEARATPETGLWALAKWDKQPALKGM